MIIALLILLHIITTQVAGTLHVRIEHEQTLRVLFLSSTIYISYHLHITHVFSIFTTLLLLCT